MTTCSNFEDKYFPDVLSRRKVIGFYPQHSTFKLVLPKAPTVQIIKVVNVYNTIRQRSYKLTKQTNPIAHYN